MQRQTPTRSSEDPYVLSSDLLIPWRHGVASAIDLSTGKERWSRQSMFGEFTDHAGPVGEDRLQVPSADGKVSEVVDLRSGRLRFDLPPSSKRLYSLSWRIVASIGRRLVIEDALSILVIDESDGSITSSMTTDVRSSPIEVIGSTVIQAAPSRGVIFATLKLR